MNRVFTTIGDVNDISGFFKKYNTINNAHFVSLFGSHTENDIETLDFLLSDIFGSKVLTQKYADIYNESGADVLMGRITSIADKYFYNNWLSFKQSIETALNSNLSKPLETEKTIETQKTGNNETQNKLNAFDISTASDTDRTDNRYSDNFSTTETTHYSNGKTPTENAKKQIDFTKNNDLIELIINDVVSICCLDIYDENYTCSRTSSGESGDDQELETRVTQCENDITDIKKLIPTTATEQNKLATIADVQSGYDDTELRGLIQKNTKDIQDIYTDLTGYATKQELQVVENSIPDVTNLATKSEVQAITDLIPSNATIQNKLATMADIGGGGGSGGSGGSYYIVGQEVDTGNIYKDGSTEKPIYRRVVNVSSVTQGSDVDVNVSFAGVTRFINITGSYNLNGIRHGIGYYNQSGSFVGVQAEVRMSLIRFSVRGSGLTFTDVSLIIEYIK